MKEPPILLPNFNQFSTSRPARGFRKNLETSSAPSDTFRLIRALKRGFVATWTSWMSDARL